MSVSRPVRYTGGEVNQVRKDPQKVSIKFALCFPDIYEIGMSHTGGRIIYNLLNGQEDIMCERVFAPWTDAREKMRSMGIKLFSLENRIPIVDFDVIGFSVHYEMSFSTIVGMLHLGGIEPLWDKRDESSPLLIAGGPSVFNPEPVARIFDLFYLGDAEQNLVTLLREYKRLKASGLPRKKILERLSSIGGVYVPSLWDVRYDGLYPTSEPALKVIKAVTPVLTGSDYPVAQIVPLTEAVQDRFVVEIQRGCTHGCRFCYAGFIYRPVRQREGKDIFDIVTDGIRKSGFQEVSFLSLSAGDYSGLGSIMNGLNQAFYPDRISLSLPSLRVDTASPELLAQISKVKKTGITIAPEAGSEKMRQRINKNITDEDIIRSVETAFSAGWELIKLYFMIGLPDETDEDIREICSLSYKVLDAAKKYRKRPDINITISPFVPKPHTPLQWESLESEENLHKKLGIIRKNLTHPAFRIKKVNLPLVRIEALLSRGDRRVLDLITGAVEKGSYLDAWTDHFDISCYLGNENDFFEKYGLRISDYLGAREKGRPLPWDIISTGVSKSYLESEAMKYHSGITTEDCFTGECSRCGVCGDMAGIVRAKEIDESDLKTDICKTPVFEEKITYYRMQYAKEGDIIYASQLDMVNIFTKMLLMSGLSPHFRGEFNPRIEMSLGPALPIGVFSTTEFLDFTLKKSIPNDYAAKILARFLPSGIRIIDIISSGSRFKSVSQSVAAARFDVIMPVLPSDEEIAGILGLQKIPVMRKKGDVSKEVDIRRFIHDIRKSEKGLSLFLLYKEDGTANIFEVLRLFGILNRSNLIIRKDKIYFSVNDI